MQSEEPNKKAYHLSLELPATGVIAFGVCLSAISLLWIAVGITPISKRARTWNSCINTTSKFLSLVPSFTRVGEEGIEAMSVSLCNGSTPQRKEESSN